MKPKNCQHDWTLDDWHGDNPKFRCEKCGLERMGSTFKEQDDE